MLNLIRSYAIFYPWVWLCQQAPGAKGLGAQSPPDRLYIAKHWHQLAMNKRLAKGLQYHTGSCNVINTSLSIAWYWCSMMFYHEYIYIYIYILYIYMGLKLRHFSLWCAARSSWKQWGGWSQPNTLESYYDYYLYHVPWSFPQHIIVKP